MNAEIPLNMTVLVFCRCMDCSQADECAVAAVDYPPDRRGEWHYCRDYDGPRLTQHVALMPTGRPTLARVAVDDVNEEPHEPCDAWPTHANVTRY
ncbi:MAG: hypothetical protein JXL80_05745 [Planctomycetes bacterium]|nr:hypothetical protein [Planctomycetota bacterium]